MGDKLSEGTPRLFLGKHLFLCHLLHSPWIYSTDCAHIHMLQFPSYISSVDHIGYFWSQIYLRYFLIPCMCYSVVPSFLCPGYGLSAAQNCTGNSSGELQGSETLWWKAAKTFIRREAKCATLEKGEEERVWVTQRLVNNSCLLTVMQDHQANCGWRGRSVGHFMFPELPSHNYMRNEMKPRHEVHWLSLKHLLAQLPQQGTQYQNIAVARRPAQRQHAQCMVLLFGSFWIPFLISVVVVAWMLFLLYCILAGERKIGSNSAPKRSPSSAVTYAYSRTQSRMETGNFELLDYASLLTLPNRYSHPFLGHWHLF